MPDGTATTNVAEVTAAVTALTHVMDLTAPSQGAKTFADAAFDVIAAGIHERSLNQQTDPAGQPWALNKGPYGKRKRRRGVPIGVSLKGDEVGGEMLEFEQLRGETVITPTGASMTYGKDEEERQKMEWFTVGRPGIQAPRETYELDAEIEKRLDELSEDQFEARMRAAGAY